MSQSDLINWEARARLLESQIRGIQSTRDHDLQVQKQELVFWFDSELQEKASALSKLEQQDKLREKEKIRAIADIREEYDARAKKMRSSTALHEQRVAAIRRHTAEALGSTRVATAAFQTWWEGVRDHLSAWEVRLVHSRAKHEEAMGSATELLKASEAEWLTGRVAMQDAHEQYARQSALVEEQRDELQRLAKDVQMAQEIAQNAASEAQITANQQMQELKLTYEGRLSTLEVKRAQYEETSKLYEEENQHLKKRLREMTSRMSEQELEIKKQEYRTQSLKDQLKRQDATAKLERGASQPSARAEAEVEYYRQSETALRITIEEKQNTIRELQQRAIRAKLTAQKQLSEVEQALDDAQTELKDKDRHINSLERRLEMLSSALRSRGMDAETSPPVRSVSTKLVASSRIPTISVKRPVSEAGAKRPNDDDVAATEKHSGRLRAPAGTSAKRSGLKTPSPVRLDKGSRAQGRHVGRAGAQHRGRGRSKGH